MKKINNKGFIFAETVVVSTIVLIALVSLYTQFNSINNSYRRAFKYNTVDKLYAAYNLKTFISENRTNYIIEILNNGSVYTDITSCSADYFTEYMYCEMLIDTLNIKKAIFTKEDLSTLKSDLNNNNVFTENMKDFIKYIKSDNSGKYRVIIEFNDDTFATLKINSSI